MAASPSQSPAQPRWTRTLAWLGGQWAFRSQARAASLLYGFARTEQQSQLELRQAAQACEDPRRRARYLRHALDEARHAEAFAQHAAELARSAGAPGFARPSAASERLYETLGEARFLAFVHQGERRGRVEFETYARLLRKRGSSSLAALFDALVKDELEHEAYSARLLAELVGDAAARRAQAWAARWTAWRDFRRRGHALAGATYRLAMLLVYASLAPFALLARVLDKPRRGFSREP